MKTLFGASMDSVMVVTLALFLLVTAAVAVLALRNRLLFKLALRNIPRRRAQTALIITGLMLSTVIITSAFGTGDTVSYSIRSLSVANLGAVDEIVTTNSGVGSGFGGTAAGRPGFFPADTADRLLARLAAGTAAGVTGAIVQAAPLQDLTTRQTKGNTLVLGLPAGYPAAFGALVTAAGATVTLGQLGAHEVYLNARAAQALAAHRGDRLQAYVGSVAVPLVVRDVLRNDGLAAGGLLSSGQSSDPEVVLPLDRLQSVIGRPGQITHVLISNRGDALAGAGLTAAVAGRVRALLARPGQVAAVRALLVTPAGRAALRQVLKDPLISANAQTAKKLRDLQAQLLRGLGIGADQGVLEHLA
jgi:putative ABC transport system permease protein